VLPTGVRFTGCYSLDINRTPFVIGTSPGALCIPVHQTISAFPVLDKVSGRSLDVKVTQPAASVGVALVLASPGRPTRIPAHGGISFRTSGSSVPKWQSVSAIASGSQHKRSLIRAGKAREMEPRNDRFGS